MCIINTVYMAFGFIFPATFLKKILDASKCVDYDRRKRKIGIYLTVACFVAKIWPLALRQLYRLRVSQNQVMRMFRTHKT